MTLQTRSAPRVRRRPATWLWLLPMVAGLALVAGCKHRRQAYRPIFAAPAVIEAPAAPCPGGDCGGTALPPPAFPDSAAISPPPAGPLGSEPVAPAGGGGVTPGAGEPAFDLNAPAGGDDGLGRAAPTLEAPRSSSRYSPRSARRAVGGERRNQLRRDVQAFANDPDDLVSPPRAERPWRYVVLHHSAHPEGGLGQIDRQHREELGTDGCGYHFVIGNGTESPDGRIEVAARWAEQKAGAHCRDCNVPAANEYGIGICLVGDLDRSPPTPRQIEAARTLVAYLRDRYAIPEANVRAHSGVAKTATSCPGRLFPAQAILDDPDRNLAAR